jgi:ribosome-associated translation inhibitor RaiA
MSLQFQFFGFDPDHELKRNANRSLDRLLDLAPYGSVPVALLEKTVEGFRCAIDLYTQHGPLVAHSCQSTASQALTHVCKTLHKKLERWKELQIQGAIQEARLSAMKMERGA